MSEYNSYVWARLYNAIGNEYGVAGLMGNLQAESGVIPYRLQGDFSLGYTNSIRYTNNVNDGSYTRSQFVDDSRGYGLAQWTYSSRKAGLYDMWQSGGYTSIGDIDLAVDYLLHELTTSYGGVLSVLISATSVREASDIVLHDYENPADQSTSVEIYRASLGTTIYNELATGELPPIDVPTEPDTPDRPTIPKWLYKKLADNSVKHI